MNIEEKLKAAPENDFIQSLRTQYKSKGYLSVKQENILNEIIENKHAEKQSRKQYKYEDKEPESLSDLLL